MTVFCNTSRLGIANLDTVDTTARVSVGTTIEGYDDVTGQESEYQYVRFAATTTVGQAVTLNNTTKAVLASSTTHANSGIAIGFAVGASYAADQYGWVQTGGKAKVKAATVAAAGKVQLTTTAGTVDDAAVAGAQLAGAVFETADGTPAAGFAYANINRPRVQTQIT